MARPRVIHFWQNFYRGSVADLLAAGSHPPLKNLHHSSVQPMRSAAPRDDQEGRQMTPTMLVYRGMVRLRGFEPRLDPI
jgi:hypothetical protein